MCRKGTKYDNAKCKNQKIHDELVKSAKQHLSIIPVQTGIQYSQAVTRILDTRFRGYDDFLRMNQK